MSKPNFFEKIRVSKPPRAAFDLTHDVKLSANMGNLIPIMNIECVPGDTFKLGCESLIRFQPLVAPVMHRMDVTMHYFFVPNRILWDGWEKFITNPSSGLVHPFISYDNTFSLNEQKFFDYMGVPPNKTTTAERINAFPFAAYQAIYNEYYRDQNLVPEVDYKLTDGDNYANGDLFRMRRRAWEHDYFTSCLPFAQKGAAVDLPLGEIQGDVRVFGNNAANTTLTGSAYSPVLPAGTPSGLSIPANQPFANTDGLEVSGGTIAELRKAFRLQEWLEKQARGGTRYVEQILMHFGVRSQDARLQRPEYITGIKSPVVISEVLNTTGEATGLPQGNMAGHGVAVSSGGYGKYYCQEHGFIIGIMSIMPKTAYQQGIPKHFLKSDSLDYYWPSFANIGEQPVLKKEVFAYTANGDDTFGYIPRYAEYKFQQNRVAGDLRNTLDYWHLGRIFANEPNLNQTFIECDPESTKRIFAVTDPGEDALIVHVLNKVEAIRPMPYFGTPMI